MPTGPSHGDQDLVVLEQSVYSQLLSEMAAMRTGLLQLQGLLQQQPAVDVDEEDKGDKEVEGGILCEDVDGVSE